MSTTNTSNPSSASLKALSSPIRDIVRAVLFLRGGDATLDELRTSIDHKFDSCLPRNWRLQVRDVLKHDPDIEESGDGSWLLRSADRSDV